MSAKISVLTAVAVALVAQTPHESLRPSRPANDVLLGFTLTHTDVHCNKARAGGQVRKGAGVDDAHNIVLHYDQPDIRARTRTILAGMIGEGARLVRTILWFRDTTQDDKPSGADVLGLLRAHDGTLPEQKVQNIVAFASDARAAGYRELVLVPGPLIEASPKCRAVEFGACFDETTLGRTWSLVAQIKRAIQPLSTSRFRILLDIGPETCPTISRQPVGRTLAQYTEFMIAHYSREFHDGEFIVSCGGGATATQGLTRLRALASLYRQLHVKPAGLDLHMYFENPSDYGTALAGAEAEAEHLNTNLFVLETYLDNGPMFDALRRLRDAAKLDRLSMLAVWPLKSNAGCQLSEGAPFPLDLLKRATETGPPERSP
jgi:hypothetical protein